MLLENIHMHSLNLLIFLYIVVFYFETTQENANLAILEELEMQVFCALS